MVSIPTNFNIDLQFATPPFYKRLFAWAIDMLLQYCYLILASYLLIQLRESMSGFNDGYALWAISLLIVLPFLTYHLLMEITMNGQSIGKKVFGIRVISENGGRPSISQYLIRWMIRTSDLTLFILVIIFASSARGGMENWGVAVAICLLIIDIILVNSAKQQRLGDILAHTILITTRQKENINETVFAEVDVNYVPVFPEVMTLIDKDINTIKSIVLIGRKNTTEHASAVAATKIKSHLGIQTDMDAITFLETLLKDYNYLSVN